MTTESIDYFFPKPIHKIGVLDSGIGGLTVLQQLVEVFPTQYYYFADNANLPYGNKSKDELLEISLKNIETLLTYNIDAILLACHTLCTTVLDDIKKKFPDVIFIDVVQPVIKKALSITKNNYIGVMGTTATIESNFYQKIVAQQSPLLQIFELACPELASLIEHYPVNDQRIKSSIKYSMKAFEVIPIDTIILGCTHYALVKKIIQKYTTAKLVSAEDTICQYLRSYFFQPTYNKDSKVHFILTESNLLFERKLKLFFNKDGNDLTIFQKTLE